MADARKARPVSGEIMAAEGRDTSAQPARPAAADIVDADFETIVPGQLLGESSATRADFLHTTPSSTGMDMLRASPGQGRVRAGHAGPAFWLAGISLAAMAFWVSGGHATLRAMAFPAAGPASFLRIVEISSRVDSSGRKPLLLVDGAAINDGASSAELPPIDISVATNDGKILRYRLGTAAARVASGARWDFSSRLDVPINGIKTVTVAFSE